MGSTRASTGTANGPRASARRCNSAGRWSERSAPSWEANATTTCCASLLVLSVVPAPNAGRLLVTIALPASAGVPVEEALQRVLHAAGHLRSEVAAAVSRRKTPELAFRVVTDAPLS